jgi:transposase
MKLFAFHSREPSMEKLIRVGLDTSKSVFQVHGVDTAERPVLRKQVRRAGLVAFFKALPPTVVGMEACGGSHHWARVLAELGHEVRLMPPEYAKPYRRRNKNDAADADALCEALSRPRMRFVRPKTIEQQAGQMLVGVREQLVRRRTQLCNQIRGYAMEFGVVAAKGLCRIEALLDHIAKDEALPVLAKELFALQARELAQLQTTLREVESRLIAWHKQSEVSRRLVAIPGVGPISATMLAMKVSQPEDFSSGRKFAAWLGLTPKDHSTAGKTRLGAITRAGDPALRSVLVVGATAVIQQVTRGQARPSRWLAELLKRKAPKEAAVALANKIARTAWKLMVSGERYDPRHRVSFSAAITT